MMSLKILPCHKVHMAAKVVILITFNTVQTLTERFLSNTFRMQCNLRLTSNHLDGTPSHVTYGQPIAIRMARASGNY
jgi:hypothetical protein